MPIYRGERPVTPVRDKPLDRVYRGDKLVWQAYRPIDLTLTFPAQTPGTAAGYDLTPTTTIPGTPGGAPVPCRWRLQIHWANRISGGLYRLNISRDGNNILSWEDELGVGPGTQTLEIGYGTNPYPYLIDASPGDVIAIRTWLGDIPNAANRAITGGTLTIQEA